MTPDTDLDTPYRAGPGTNWTALLTLVQDSFAYMEARIDPPSSMHRLTADSIARHAAAQEIWIVGPQDAPIACLFMTEKPDCLYVGKLAVAAGHRGRGHARRLIDCAETRAKEKGLPALELQSRVELTENHAAFAKMGFIKTGEDAHAGYDRPTSITMRRGIGRIGDTL